ncbi:MAG: DUF362 domain-containing protein, partial [Candidatus Omnitrophica bacterium]|nr:DUF362 domain-containing protein [Candidatus Omnitrophota bacterium]
EVSIIKCASYDTSLVGEAVRKSVELLGGIERFIKPASKVLIKPNLLMAKEPESGIITHPEVVRAVIRILKSINCKVFLGDGPSVWGSQIENVGEVYRRSGIERICREEDVCLVIFDKRRMRRNKFPMTTWLDECDYLVNVPKFKTHEFTLLTGAIKNLFGLVSGIFKMELHKRYFEVQDFCSVLVDVLEEARPALTIVDGIIAMEGDGPATAGKLRNLNLILTGNDCVSLDAVMAYIMGLEPTRVLTTAEAARRKLGVADIKSILTLGEKLNDIKGRPFLLPSTSPIRKKIPKPVINLVKQLIKYYPYIKQKNCVSCSICIQSCPTGAMTIQKKRIIFDYSKCIFCFCCQEVCPYSAIRVKKSLLAKLMGL